MGLLSDVFEDTVHIAYMNPNKEAQLDHILAGTDYADPVQAMKQPGSMQGFLWAAKFPNNNAKSREEICRSEMVLAMGLLFVFPKTVFPKTISPKEA